MAKGKVTAEDTKLIRQLYIDGLTMAADRGEVRGEYSDCVQAHSWRVRRQPR